jgi:hypothetical protein
MGGIEMRRTLAGLIVAILLCVGLSPGLALGASFSPGSAGIGDPYYPLDGNGGYNVVSYDLDLRYEPDRDRLRGVATITAKATKNLSRFNLDFVGLKLRSAKVNGRDARTRRDGQELIVTPRRGIPKGSTFTAVFRYDGVPEPIVDLFGVSGFMHTEDGALVLGQPHVAAYWFPANDHPRDKARFRIKITVPKGLEAISNGVLVRKTTSGRWSTWDWNAREPMAPYLAMMAIGQFDVHAYRSAGIRYWDAIDPQLLEDLVAPATPTHGSQMLYSQVGEPAYKRLTRVISVPAGGSTLTFDVNRETEPGWDFLFVEARTAGGNDWTTLPDINGHTNQEVGACPGFLEANPFLEHYLTVFVLEPGDPSTPEDDVLSCNPTGSTGAWHAISGPGDGWETWSVRLPNTTSAAKNVEVSITYASDFSVQGRGVALDNVVSSTGVGSTSFEADGNVLDGWTAPIAGPTGSAPNPNTWTTETFLEGVPGLGVFGRTSLDRQPEIIKTSAGWFGPYPFNASGGVIDAAPFFFALETQTRPVYSPVFFFGGPNDFVVVHELAHQWFGDSLALHEWQHIWLNEGFATYAEWLWSEREGFGTTQEIFDSFVALPAEDEFWSLAIGDPGPEHLFDFPVYGRGAMTLHALRVEVGDADFFRIVRTWARTQKGGTVTTREFIRLAERISGEDLDDLFDEWLSAGRPASLPPPPPPEARGTASVTRLSSLPDAVQELATRLKDRRGNPYR